MLTNNLKILGMLMFRVAVLVPLHTDNLRDLSHSVSPVIEENDSVSVLQTTFSTAEHDRLQEFVGLMSLVAFLDLLYGLELTCKRRK